MYDSIGQASCAASVVQGRGKVHWENEHVALCFVLDKLDRRLGAPFRHSKSTTADEQYPETPRGHSKT